MVIFLCAASCSIYKTECKAGDPSCNLIWASLLYQDHCLWESKFVTFQGSNSTGIQIGHSLATMNLDQGSVTVSSITANFGNPIEAFHGGSDDTHVVRYDRFGKVIWSTFIGSSDDEAGNNPQTIKAFPGSSDFLITSSAKASFKNPLLSHTGPVGVQDASLIRINANGAVVWNTFLGATAAGDSGIDVVFAHNDQAIFLWKAGGALSNVGATPLQAHSGVDDFGIGAIDSNGSLQWHTFFGGAGGDKPASLAITPENQILVAGTVGAAVNGAFANQLTAPNTFDEVVVVRYDISGNYLSHLFFGGVATDDSLLKILPLPNGEFILMGATSITFGTGALIAHTGGSNFDYFILKSDANGNVKWFTFVPLSSTDNNAGSYSDISFDRDGNILLAAGAAASFGSPIHAYNGGPFDILLAQIDVNNGKIIKHSFLGGTNQEFATGIQPSCDGGYAVSIIGSANFGEPLNSFATGALFNPGLLKTDSNFSYQ